MLGFYEEERITLQTNKKLPMHEYYKEETVSENGLIKPYQTVNVSLKNDLKCFKMFLYFPSNFKVQEAFWLFMQIWRLSRNWFLCCLMACSELFFTFGSLNLCSDCNRFCFRWYISSISQSIPSIDTIQLSQLIRFSVNKLWVSIISLLVAALCNAKLHFWSNWELLQTEHYKLSQILLSTVYGLTRLDLITFLVRNSKSVHFTCQCPCLVV